MTLEEILEENGELLLEKIKNLKVATAGSTEEADIRATYDAVFKNHIALLKTNEEAIKNDNDEHIAEKKLEQAANEFEAKMELEKSKLEQEKNIDSDRRAADAESVDKKLNAEKDIQAERIKVDRERLELDKVIAENNANKFEKLDLGIKIVTCAGAIITPLVCELIKQKMHMDVSKMVLAFEETGSITSTIGRAEFRK